MANAREILKAAEDWYGWNSESLSAGLRNAFDALRLWDYAQAHTHLPEMADEWKAKDLVKALGYNPFEEPNHEAKTTGAVEAAEALSAAKTLIDSVAFVSKEGDTEIPLRLICAALGETKEAERKAREKC